MSEEQILNAIANYCQDERLIFQVIVQDTQAHIYVNRQTEDEIDYSQLTDKIVTAVSSLDDLDIEQICLYSRISGEIEPDWQTAINLTASNTNEAVDCQANNAELEINNNSNTAQDDSEVSDLFLDQDKKEIINISDNNISAASQENEDLAEMQLDLTSYCFIRNKRLLSSELVPPKLNIAQLIKTFHEFENPIKEEQLPLLCDYFQKSYELNTADLSPEIKSWWDEVLELSSEESRKIAIWLSRYCFNVEETLATIESVFSAAKAIAESKQKSTSEKAEKINSTADSGLRSSTEYRHVPQQQSNRISQLNSKNSGRNTTHKPTLNLLLPIIWLVVTLSLAIVDLNQPTNAFPVVCENLVQENLDYCLLATKIAGEESVHTVIDNLPEPLTEEEYLVPEALMSNGSMNCELHGNIAAGIPLKEAAPFKTPVASASTKEILPDFYVADVEQTNLKEGDTLVRTVCFFYRTKTIGNRHSIKLLAFDQVDLGWPTIAYEPTKKVKSLRTLNKTTHTYNFFSLFGINTLFTAIAIYLVAICGMAIKVNSIETIYQASFILGITKSILGSLPMFGFFIIVPLECVALAITSGCVKGLKIDWNCGYPFVAATAMLLIGLRMLFTFLFLGFLSAVFG